MAVDAIQAIPIVRLSSRISGFLEDRESFAGLNLAQRFRRIHDTNLWGAAASTSGLGSEMDATAVLRAELPRLLEKLGRDFAARCALRRRRLDQRG